MIEMTQAEVDEARKLAKSVIDVNDPDLAWQAHDLARAVHHLAERLTLQRECVMAYEFELSQFKRQLAEAKDNLAASEMALRNTAERPGGTVDSNVAVQGLQDRLCDLHVADIKCQLAEAQTTIAKLREDRCATRVKDRLGL